ncbi:unnamed protein product [Soboliphyme baturini]|uniref:HMG box domain-containing protein n=1 Tax=Soboliphyme baturini TaxID=241478 RepID=A0A183IJM5_9BILA|nr:unnamed protein product [Soboliphyme baturini]
MIDMLAIVHHLAARESASSVQLLVFIGVAVLPTTCLLSSRFGRKRPARTAGTRETCRPEEAWHQVEGQPNHVASKRYSRATALALAWDEVRRARPDKRLEHRRQLA